MSVTMDDFRKCRAAMLEISVLEDRIAWIESRIQQGTAQLTGMPKAQGKRDVFADSMDKLIATRALWGEAVMQYAERVLSVSQAIQGIQDETQRTLMRLRYVDGCEWEEIGVRISYSRTQCYRIHQDAHDAIFEKMEHHGT